MAISDLETVFLVTQATSSLGYILNPLVANTAKSSSASQVVAHIIQISSKHLSIYAVIAASNLVVNC